MFLTMAVLGGVLVGTADALIFQKGKKYAALLLTMVCDGLVSNILAISVSNIIFNFINGGTLFTANAQMEGLPYLYFGITVAVGAVWVILHALADGKLFYEKNMEKRKKVHIVLGALSVFFVLLGTAAFTGTIWGKDTFGDISPDQMVINLFSPTDGTSDEIMSTLWTGPVFQTLAVTLFFALFVFSTRVLYFRKKDANKKIFSLFVRRIVSLVLSAAVCAGGIAYGVVQFELAKLFRMYVMESDFIEENYADPEEVKLQFPEKKRNLIHIYLESMENSYTTTDMGGYLDENLIAPLTDLAEEGISFSHLSEGFGGAVATTGCTWSVASMVNMNTGLPMKVPTEGNSYGSPDNFLPGVITLGDILESQGYEQSLMFGATAKFGGLNYFYQSHGNFNILDHDAAIEKGWIPEDYHVWWGYEDDKLFEYAKTELTRLYETGKPFNFVMETADTHFPDGYVGPNTPTPRDSQYANVIAYSASETEKFIRWIREQPFYENTTIVIIGDHLSMDANFFSGFDEDYLRTTFNLILNPADGLSDIPKERTQNRWWANFDMFPTILASIGVKIEGERLGLGTNLFSDTPTLFEEHGGEDGWEKINKIFEMKSSFYNENILVGDNAPFDTKNVSYY